MKTAQHVDLELSRQVTASISPDASRCYWNAHAAALALGEDAHYCEGWALLPMPLAPGQKAYIAVAHGWVELNGRIIDTAGAAALAYFPSSSRPITQVDARMLSLHAHDKQAARRHQRAMRKALDYLLSQSADWAAIVCCVPPPEG